MRYTILVSVLAITFGVSFGQEMIVGQVFNLQTREPIPFAHIVSAKLGTTTNLDGKFRIPAHAGDTLLITHVNYEPLRVMITSDSMNIYLRPGDVLLDEIIIGLLPSEDQFKKRLLE
ncbi:MAG: carboxypeptidase-like regulatory domain-containing protein, partial [Marinoscillum sp.]